MIRLFKQQSNNQAQIKLSTLINISRLNNYNGIVAGPRRHFTSYHNERLANSRLSNNNSLFSSIISPRFKSFKAGIVSECSTFNVSSGAYCFSKNEKNIEKDKQCTPDGCGEDSYCITENKSEVVLAVADAVSAWRSIDVDPALFSRSLMRHTGEIAKSSEERLQSDPESPKTILIDAFKGLVDEFQSGQGKPFGASTACIVMINRLDGRLKFGNLGDSGFMILKPVKSKSGEDDVKYKIKFRSQSQQHGFNTPYQLTLAPPDGRVGDSTHLTATDSSIKPPLKYVAKVGDVVLLMTDGVLDNIFDKELVEIVAASIKLHSQKHSMEEIPDLVAQDIALKAREFSKDRKRNSPFAIEANKHQFKFMGGKEDDITVVTAIVYPKSKK